MTPTKPLGEVPIGGSDGWEGGNISALAGEAESPATMSGNHKYLNIGISLGFALSRCQCADRAHPVAEPCRQSNGGYMVYPAQGCDGNIGRARHPQPADRAEGRDFRMALGGKSG